MGTFCRGGGFWTGPTPYIAEVAQLVEQPFCKRQVVGSSPTRGTTYPRNDSAAMRRPPKHQTKGSAMRRLIAFLAIACMAIVSQPAFAQSQINLTGYVSPTGRATAVRPLTPLPTTNLPYALRASTWVYAGATGGIVNTSTVAIQAAAGAGIRSCLVSLQLFNSAAVASEITVSDGSTVVWRGYVSASMVTPELIDFPIPLCTSANAALNIAALTTATATRVSAQGYTTTN